MATNLESLLVRIDASTETLRRELKRADDSMDRTSKRIAQSNSSIEQSFERVGASAKRVAVSVASAFVSREVLRYADAYKTLENRIKVANDGIGDVTQTLNRLYDIAQKTRVPLDGTVTLFQRASMASKELGASQEQLFAFTENVSKALAIQGGSAASASGALLQLSQALGAGTVRAEEFNSILEGAFPIAQAAARGIDEAGGSVAKLRQMVIDGQVSSKAFFEAILSQTDQLGQTFGQTTGTIAQSLQQLEDSLTKFVGESASVKAATKALSEAIAAIAENLGDITQVATVAAGVFAGKYAASLGIATVAQLRATQQAIANQVALTRMAGASYSAAAATTALTGALRFFLTTPIGLAITGLALGFASLSLATDDTKTATEKYNEVIAKSGERLAEAAGAGEARRLQLIDEQKQIIETTKADIARTKALIEQFKAEEKLALARQNDFQSAKVGAMPEALEANRNKKENEKALEAQAKALEQLLSDLENLSTANKDAAKTQNDFSTAAANTEKTIKERIKALKEQSETVEIGTAEHQKLVDEIYRLEQALSGISSTQEKHKKQQEAAAKASKEAAKEFEKQEKEAEKLQERLAEEFARPFENAMDNIQDLTTETFEKIFDGSIDSAADAADAMKRIFIRLAAEMATLAIFRPQVMAAGGLGGTLSSVINGPSGGGGAGGFGGLSDAASFAANIPTMNQFLTGNIGGFNAINQFGAEYLGTGLVGQGGVTGVSLSGIGMNAGIGGMIAGIAGLSSGNMAVDTIASLAGSYGGSALASALGAGSFAGPAGIAGAIALSALGGKFFGGKPSDKGQYAFADLSGNVFQQGGAEGKKFSQENRDAATQFAALGGSLAGLIGKIDGTAQAFDQVQVKVGSRDGSFVVMANGNELVQRVDAAGRSGAAILDAIMQGILSNTSGLPAEIEKALGAVNFTDDFEKAFADINFIVDFEKLGAIPSVMSEVEAAVATLKAQFEEAAKTANRLGLSIEKVTAAEKAQMDELRRSVDQTIARQILQIIDPSQLAMIDEQNRYEQQLNDLFALNASAETLKKAELLHQLQMQQALEQTGGAVSDTVAGFERLQGKLNGFLFELQFGKFAGDTPTQNLASMRAYVEDLGNRAALGDIAAGEELADLLPAFLELSQQVTGGNAEFARDREMAQRLAERTLSVADRQLSLLQTQTSVLQSGFDLLAGKLDSLLAGSGLSGADLLASAGSTPAIFNAAGYLRANPDVLAEAQKHGLNPTEFARTHYDKYGQFEGRRPSGFASGGLVTGAGGVDKIPAMLTNREFVMRENAVRSIGIAQMDYMNRHGRLPANDNAMLAKLDQVVQAVDMVGRTIAAGENLSAEQREAMLARLDNLGAAARVKQLS